MLAVLGLLLVGSVAAYVVGRLQTAARIDQATGRADQAASAQQKEASKVQSAEAEVLRLESRRRLHLVLLAMDERNFGIAQQHLSEAGVLLGQADPSTDSELGKLGAAIRECRLVATEDLGVQRAKVLDWARRFDEVQPPIKAK